MEQVNAVKLQCADTSHHGIWAMQYFCESARHWSGEECANAAVYRPTFFRSTDACQDSNSATRRTAGSQALRSHHYALLHSNFGTLISTDLLEVALF